MLAAAADIQRTIATMKANAMGDAVAQLGYGTDSCKNGSLLQFLSTFTHRNQ